MMPCTRRLLTLGGEHEPLLVQLHVAQIDEAWAVMILAADVPVPGPGGLWGLALFAETAEEAEQAALDYLEGPGRRN